MRRREFLKTAAAVAGASAAGLGSVVSTLASPPGVAQAAPAGGAIIDRVVRAGRVRLGVDLTFPPLQFRDPKTQEPTGYCVEISKAIAKDLGVQIEWVELPFAQLIPAMLAGRFDWSGIGLTITPERAKSVRFVDEPLFTEDSVLLIPRDFTLKSLDDLNKPTVTISNLVGSAQDATARLLWPRARFKPLQQQEAMLEVASGRAQACLVAAWVAVPFAEQNRNVRIWEGGSVIHDVNAVMLPAGDEKTAYWLANWFRYHGAHRLPEGLWKKWLGEFLAKVRQYSRPR
ncbi:MAG: transporter substrate-binding domain-containing protein [Armatimonadota bacterium]|nr:transporter substrate-binding domain-containing protein [Armatimonadota bacterium]MDR7611756.1 transporter substrate-binding domain-containing protein [Armatimonadota bacterium]